MKDGQRYPHVSDEETEAQRGERNMLEVTQRVEGRNENASLLTPIPGLFPLDTSQPQALPISFIPSSCQPHSGPSSASHL